MANFTYVFDNNVDKYIERFVGESYFTTPEESQRIAFLGTTGQIATKGHLYGAKSVSVSSESQSLTVDGAKYSLVANADGSIALSKYLAASAADVHRAAGTANNATASYYIGANYVVTATVTPNNNALTYTVVSNGNPIAFVSSDAVIEDGVISGVDYSTIDLTGTWTPETKETTSVTVGDGDAVMEWGNNVTAKTISDYTTLSGQSTTIYWHEKGTDAIQAIDVYTEDVKATATAKAQANWYNKDSEIVEGSLGTATSVTSKISSFKTLGGQPSIAYPADWGTATLYSKIGLFDAYDTKVLTINNVNYIVLTWVNTNCEVNDYTIEFNNEA